MKIRKQCDAVFAFPPQESGDFIFHYGSAALIAWLKTHGISSFLWEGYGCADLSTVARELLSYSPRVIGFPSYDTNIYSMRLLARHIRAYDKDVLLLAGGPTPSSDDVLVLELCPELDAVIRGDGEGVLSELLEKDLSGNLLRQHLHSIDGISFMDGDKCCRTDRQALLGLDSDAGLDVLPSPYLEEIIPVDTHFRSGLGAMVVMSKGCPHHCTYCNYSSIYNHTVRHFSVERIIDELSYMRSCISDRSKKYTVYFNGDSFSFDSEHALDMLNELQRGGFKESFEFVAHIRADATDDEVLRGFKEAGFSNVNIGLESASISVLKGMNKLGNVSNKEAQRAYRNFLQTCVKHYNSAKRLGLHLTFSVVFGMPFEARQDAYRTLQFLECLDPSIEYGHNSFIPFTGSPICNSKKFASSLRLRPGMKILPRVASYPHDVYSLPRLDNAMFTLRDLDRNYIRLAHSGKGMQAFCFSDAPVERLGDYLDLDASCYCVVNEGGGRECLTNFHRNYIPYNVLVLGRDPFKTRKGRELLLPDWAEGRHLRTQGSLSFLKKSDERKLSYQYDFVSYLRTMSRPSDIDTFVSMMRRIDKQDGCFQLKDPGFYLHWNAFWDECRWGAGKCPASIGKKIVFRGDGCSSCYHAERISGYDDGLDGYLDAVNERIQEHEDVRGCKTCSIRDECSRCPSPHPLTDAEYCRTRRAYPFIPLALGALRFYWEYVFSYFKGEAIEPKFWIPSRVDPAGGQCVVILCRKEWFCCYLDDDEVFLLSPEEAEGLVKESLETWKKNES